MRETTYLICVFYENMTTERKYAHSLADLHELLKTLIKNDKVYDFKVYKQIDIETL